MRRFFETWGGEAMGINTSEQAGVRYLHFGSSWVQGAMRMARPWDLELEYTREMMAALLLREGANWPQRVLLIGLGAASLTKFVYRYLPLAQLTVVEIEPAVVRMARQSFALPAEDARLEVVVADGVEYVAGATQKFDLILVDGFNAKADPGGLNTLPFYQSCREKLNPEGVFGVNLLGLCRGVLGGFAHVHAAFDGRAEMFPPCPSGNTIAFATQGLPIDCSLAELSERAAVLQQNTGLNLLPTLARLAQSERCLDGRLVV